MTVPDCGLHTKVSTLDVTKKEISLGQRDSYYIQARTLDNLDSVVRSVGVLKARYRTAAEASQRSLQHSASLEPFKTLLC